MPQHNIMGCRNLLELLELTESYSEQELEKRFNSAGPDGIVYATTINDRLTYSLKNQPRQTFETHPIQFAITRGLFHRIQFLYEHGATHEIRGYQAFATLVHKNAPLELLQYCMNNNKCHDDEKYPALLAAYRQKDRALEKFEAIHEYCFGLSFEAILLEKRPEGMLPAAFETALKAYSVEVARCGLLKEQLKTIYLDIIRYNPDYKSYLKTNLVFGKENPIVNFLRINQADSTILDTAHFQVLQLLLKGHKLMADDVSRIRLQLNGENKPNQALAGLYFAYYDFSNIEDYALFRKNLVDPRDTYDQAAQRNFERLLKSYLNNDEMKKLKENCLHSLNDLWIKQDIKQELDKQLAKSPMGTIIRTGTRTRKEKATGTLAKAMKFCLFAHQEVRVPPAAQQEYLNMPPAYNPQHF